MLVKAPKERVPMDDHVFQEFGSSSQNMCNVRIELEI